MRDRKREKEREDKAGERERGKAQGRVGIEPHLHKQTTASPKKKKTLSSQCQERASQVLTSCGPQITSSQKIAKKRLGTVQYVRFPGGPPPEYWTRPWLLSFGDRTGSGVSNQV